MNKVLNLFFEKSERRQSTKPFIILRKLILILGIICLILIIKSGFKSFEWLWLFIGVGNLTSGFEDLLNKKAKSDILLEFGVALLSFLLFLQII